MTLSTQAAARKDLTTGKSTMQHRHFTTVAAIIRKIPYDKRRPVAELFADELAETNPNFDRDRFLTACKGL